MDPSSVWNQVLAGQTDILRVCADLDAHMRAARLTFGGRLLCPFLRPFFLDATDEARVKEAAETLWTLGERIAQAAMTDRSLLEDLALSEEEIRLATIDPGYQTTSTAARADAFVLPDSLQFAEYNGESPAGAAYSQGLAEAFNTTELMTRFRDRMPDVRMYRPIPLLLDALIASYREWGGTARPPLMAIVDWKDVPTYSEFEILAEAFTNAGVPTIIADPRDLELVESGSSRTLRSSGSSRALRSSSDGRPIDLVYRRVLINDIIARPDECRALVEAYEHRLVCVANSLRCKIPHKKAFFAVLTDERRAYLFSDRERELIRRHVPRTILVREDTIPYLREHRERLVIKPNDEYGGTGVTLGWETDAREWDRAIERAAAERSRGWVAQEKIIVRREPFPVCTSGGVDMRDMLVDFAPYLFRGKLAGFLTRLSATGLANVTSGGGQVPAFVTASTI